MKFFTIYFMAFLFASPHYVYRTGIDSRFRGNDISHEDDIFRGNDRQGWSDSALVKGGIKQDQYKITAKKPKMKTQAKKPTPQKAKRLLAKEDALPKDYDKTKKSKTELVKEFEKQLTYLKQTCETKEDKQEFLQTQLNAFDGFLKISLKDPNMDYTLQLLFSDITSVIAEMNSSNLNLDTFIRLYRMLYNLPENMETANYPDYWAQVIAQSIECTQ